MMDQDILRDAAETAVAGAPLWWSYTHHVCLFKGGYDEATKAKMEIKSKHPETLDWSRPGRRRRARSSRTPPWRRSVMSTP